MKGLTPEQEARMKIMKDFADSYQRESKERQSEKAAAISLISEEFEEESTPISSLLPEPEDDTEEELK